MTRIRRHMLRANVAWFFCVALAALIQTNWPELLRLQDVSPDVVLVLIVYFGIAYGEERAMLTGLVGGLYQDVAINVTLGHHVLCYVLVGYFIGRLSTRLITEHAAIKAGLVFLAGLCQGILFVAIQYAQQPQRGMLAPVLTTVAPVAFYSALITPLVFIMVDRMFRRHEIVSDGIL